ncbi:hypothetical protein FRC09_019897, partial [Ceratobasidium sp. 395]
VNTADLTTAEATLQNHDASITNLDTLMVQALAGIAAVQGTGSSGQSTRAPKLTVPAKFDGSDKNKATSFRVAVSHYLRVSYPRSTVDEQIAFIISCLDGKAHEWLEPYLEQDVVVGAPVTWLHDLPGFWAQFNARWNVANKTENFRAKFKALKQTKSVQEYFKDFQTYSQGLGYNDQSLRDSFYDGLSIRIKEILMTQNYDHLAPTVTLQLLADKALQIDQRLEAFQAQNKGAYTQSTSSGSKNTSSPSAASPGIARDKMSVGEKVYMLGSDGKARKGTVQAIGKNDKGAKVPTVKWSDGSSTEVAFKQLKKDSYPGGAAAPTVVVATTTPSSKGPGPMDLDSTGKGKKPVICNNCGGRGHYASACPSRSLSGQAAQLDDSESEKEDL